MDEGQRIHTFLFADLAGYTALTEAHGDEHAADLARDFFTGVGEILARHGAEQVKTIGDALMLRAVEAGEAIGLGLCIVHDVATRHGFPSVRVGIHSGPAVQREGDWFGATVNVAARVSGLAGGAEVLLTDATRAGAGDLYGIELHARGRYALKNVAEPVVIYAALRHGAETVGDLPVDPVCRMVVEPARAAGTLVHRGVEYSFCSLDCARVFAEAPERYVGRAETDSTRTGRGRDRGAARGRRRERPGRERHGQRER